MEAVKDPDSRRDQTIERLITQHQTSLLRLCYVQLQDQALAEDAVQETLLKADEGFCLFRGDSSERTGLTIIAVNTFRDFLHVSSARFLPVCRHETSQLLWLPLAMFPVQRLLPALGPAAAHSTGEAVTSGVV